MFEIHLLGSVKVLEGGTLFPPFPTQRSKELFAILAARPNHPHARLTLAGNLWPEKSEEKARASLNTELWRVRQVLGAADSILELTRDTVSLKIPVEQVDVHKFRALVKRGNASALHEAVSLYRGEFVEGCYADWCLLEREALADQFRLALEGMLRHSESRGELSEAISFAKKLHALDPLREEIHRALMRLYAALGDRPAALAQYHACKAILQRELNVEPMPETEELSLKIRQTAPLEDHWSARRESTRKITEHRLAEMRAARQYMSELYAPRPGLEQKVDEFARSNAVALILVGRSGCGKTSLLARLAETRLAQGDLVLLLEASALTLDAQRDITRQIWGSETISATDALAALGRDAASRGRLVWILLDELNAFHDLGAGPADLLRRVDALAASLHRNADLGAVKLILACRAHAWSLIELGGNNPNWQCYFGRAPLPVETFSAEETRAAFDVYRRHFKIQNSFDDLSEEMRERFNSPFFLRLAAETWRGHSIPRSGSGGILFREYFERIAANPLARTFMLELVTRIARHRQPSLPIADLRADPSFQAAFADDHRSPFHQLLEAGALMIVGNEFTPRLRFTHERLLEYLLAQYYDAQCDEGIIGEDCVIQMARGAWDFPALWGAALTLLLLGKNTDQFLLLAESGFSEARQLATEGLVALHAEDAALARSIANRLLERASIEAKRVALFAASRMGEDGFELFRSAAGSREAETRQAVIVVVNVIHQYAPQVALSILQHMLDDLGLRTFVTSSARLQVGMSILGFFTRYGLEKNLIDDADRLIHTLTVKKLHLPSESNRMGRLLVQRLLAINTTSWPADRNAVESVARAGALTPGEETAFRRVLSCLKRRADGLDDVSLDDLQTLLACPSDAVRYLAHHQLCMWLNLRQEQSLQAIQALFDSAADPEIRSWLLMAFQPIHAPRLKSLSAEGLQSLENLTARVAEENRELFLDGISHGTLGLFGSIAFFPLGMRYAQMGNFDFPLLSAYLESHSMSASHHLRLLAPVGWFHPQAALAMFEKHVNFKKPLDAFVIESLGKIWVSHPETTEAFLRRVGLDEATQRQVRAGADIESTLRGINLIHNTDLRVSSILLGAPYGKWVTDSVFEGYVDSKSLDEAASRFGRGLVDIYMESGWRLKRILGLK
ncbi:MAG: hypothetical protein HY867_15160 [Chloroflexi bacterium]|nr:hypothetical protein [Chloroflexota bacterium]